MRVFLGTLRPLKIHTICSFWMPARKTLHILQGEPIGGLPHATAQFFREIKRAREGGRRASEYRRNKEANGCRSKLLHCNHFRIVHSSSLKFECQMSEARKRMRSVVTVRGTCDAPLRTFAVDEFTQFHRIIFCPAPRSPFGSLPIIRGTGGEECRAEETVDCRGGARCAMASHLNYVVD